MKLKKKYSRKTIELKSNKGKKGSKKVKDKKQKEVVRGKKVGKFITKEDAIRLKGLIVVKNTSEKKRKISKKKKSKKVKAAVGNRSIKVLTEEVASSLTIGDDGVLRIPEDITEIAEYAFLENYQIKSIIFPSNLKKIGESAFEGCTNLNSKLVFPVEFEEIGDRAFAGCIKLSGPLIFNTTLKKIGELAFNGCEKLECTVLVPKSVELVKGWINEGPFDGTPATVKIISDEEIATLWKIENTNSKEITPEDQFENLPDELVIMIAEYLDDESLKKYAETNKRFRYLTTKLREKRKQEYLKDTGLGEKPRKNDIREAKDLKSSERLAEMRWTLEYPMNARSRAQVDTYFYKRSKEYSKKYKKEFDSINQVIKKEFEEAKEKGNRWKPKQIR